jgi:hypothetical protein
MEWRNKRVVSLTRRIVRGATQAGSLALPPWAEPAI